MARAITDRHAPGDAQAVLARFIAEGHLLRHLRQMRELYQARQHALRTALADASDGAWQLPASEPGHAPAARSRTGQRRRNPGRAKPWLRA